MLDQPGLDPKRQGVTTMSAPAETRPPRRWWARNPWWAWPFEALLLLVLLLALLATPLACTTTIVPPRHPADPVPVFLLDHGHTSSLVLPTANGGMVRYAYGDWNYYALNHKGLWDGIAALCWPTPGTLGRKLFAGPPTLENVRQSVLIPSEHIYTFPVARARALALEDRLNRIFEANRAGLVDNPKADFQFVPFPQKYYYFDNSNHTLAGWVRELGGQTHGPALMSRWRVEAPGS